MTRGQARADYRFGYLGRSPAILRHMVAHPHRSRSRRRHRRAHRARSAACAPCSRRPAARRCAGATAALPASPRSSCRSSFRPRAPARSGAGSRAAFDPFDHERVAARAHRHAAADRPVGAEDPHAEGDRHAPSTPARSISTRSPTCRPTRRTRAHGAARHRPVDRRHLSPVLPRPRRCLAGRRPRAAGGGAPRASRCRRARPAKEMIAARRAVAAVARRWRRVCCGPIIAPSKAARSPRRAELTTPGCAASARGSTANE